MKLLSILGSQVTEDSLLYASCFFYCLVFSVVSTRLWLSPSQTPHSAGGRSSAARTHVTSIGSAPEKGSLQGLRPASLSVCPCVLSPICLSPAPCVFSFQFSAVLRVLPGYRAALPFPFYPHHDLLLSPNCHSGEEQLFASPEERKSAVHHLIIPRQTDRQFEPLAVALSLAPPAPLVPLRTVSLFSFFLLLS